MFLCSNALFVISPKWVPVGDRSPIEEAEPHGYGKLRDLKQRKPPDVPGLRVNGRNILEGI
jgi:hypothetical protein